MKMKRRSLFKLGGLAAAFSMFGGKDAAAADEVGGFAMDEDRLEARNHNRSTVVCQNGIVCASQPLAAMAGVDMLKAGGNAVDAAVAANAMLGLVEPMSCGPGGDLFSILWVEKDKKLYGLNASGRSPYNWNLKEAKKKGLPVILPNSPMAWSVPGCVSGWEALNRRFGKLPLKKIFEPVIHYAKEGFPVSPIIASHWAFDAKKRPTLARVFMPDGRAPGYGEIFKNPDLARFFEMLSNDGPRTYYQGEIAERIVRFSEREGGYFTMRDFEDHEANWVEPVSTNYRGYDVWEIPPNGQGIATLQILNILENFDIGSLEPNSAKHLHLFFEAKKLAFEDRAVYYADMDFADVPLEWLISKEYGKKRAKLINKRHASVIVNPGVPGDRSETIYLCAADGDGNMVSLIQSNYANWGSKYAPDGLGFPLQNRGQAFALKEKHRNKLEPHKRPFHTIIPAFVTKDGTPKFAFGVMGGDFQPQGQSQVTMNLLDFGMSVQQAGEQPRGRHFLSSEPMGTPNVGGGVVGFEKHIREKTIKKLIAMGHRLKPGKIAAGGYQGIWREDDPLRLFGGTDPRKDGCAIGY
jgi:gamma-glutamyltranspeptidase/glutathione hydrolase